MADRRTSEDWRRACGRGALIGVIVAAHVTLLVAVLLPVAPVPPALRRTAGRTARSIRVELLAPARAATHSPVQPALHANARSTRRVLRTRARIARRTPPRAQPIQGSLDLAPAPAASAGQPAFIAGGGLDARLRAVHRALPEPKLPGGHQYLAAALQFVPVESQSIKGKVYKVTSFLFGNFDPVCKNTQYELAKPRRQQIADGYTTRQLERRLREHDCG